MPGLYERSPCAYITKRCSVAKSKDKGGGQPDQVLRIRPLMEWLRKYGMDASPLQPLASIALDDQELLALHKLGRDASAARRFKLLVHQVYEDTPPPELELRMRHCAAEP